MGLTLLKYGVHFWSICRSLLIAAFPRSNLSRATASQIYTSVQVFLWLYY